jgi:hypothetical protein
MLRPGADALARVAPGRENKLPRSSSIASVFSDSLEFRGTINPVCATQRNCHFTNSDPHSALAKSFSAFAQAKHRRGDWKVAGINVNAKE